MPITLYKAPDCLRCKIVKDYLESAHIAYEAFDLGEHKDIVNAFYRNNRASLYRNPEGVEFPMFHDQDKQVIRQGAGLILSWLVAGKALDGCILRSDLLHGWISGLELSRCPEGREAHFLEVVRLLSGGGLKVFLRTDGRRADLLQTILDEGLAARVALDIPGPPGIYPAAVGGAAPGPEELKKTIALISAHKDGVVRLWLAPLAEAAGEYRWITPEEAGEAAKYIREAWGDMTLPFAIQAASETAGLEPLDNLLPYRARVRNHLPKADILK